MNPQSMMVSGELVWFRDRQVGYVHPIEPFRYSKLYFEDYQERSRLKASDDLMLIRRNFVAEFHTGELLDFGAGALTFVEYMRQSGHQDVFGYDINARTVQALMNSNIYRDPYEGAKWGALTFWDTLEHLEDPERIINRVGQWAFVCMPIYGGMDHARRSKHYKPGEHIWYFTEPGLMETFRRCGFECKGIMDKENGVGRSGIKSYAFKRTTT